MQKANRLDPESLTAEKALEMATIDGAKALNMEKEIGSLEVGKKADLIIVSNQVPEMRPTLAFVSNLVYAASGALVDTVIIDGRIVMHKREVLTIDEEKLLSEIDGTVMSTDGSRQRVVRPCCTAASGNISRQRTAQGRCFYSALVRWSRGQELQREAVCPFSRSSGASLQLFECSDGFLYLDIGRLCLDADLFGRFGDSGNGSRLLAGCLGDLGHAADGDVHIAAHGVDLIDGTSRAFHAVLDGIPGFLDVQAPFSVSSPTAAIIPLISTAACPVRSASLRTSSATTAKPRPCSPARGRFNRGIEAPADWSV